MKSIAVIDYGMGNLRSVAKALEYVAAANTRVCVTSNPKVVKEADRVVFPGQGAAGDCMRALEEHELIPAIEEVMLNKPFLGICMGMQVLLERSDENNGIECMGAFPGSVKYFGAGGIDDTLKIPHMGWNTVSQTVSHPLWEGIAQDSYFYFVHSYYTDLSESSLTMGTTDYGLEFTSVFAKDNIFAMQCHPEKSAHAGLALLENFTRWDGQTS